MLVRDVASREVPESTTDAIGGQEGGPRNALEVCYLTVKVARVRDAGVGYRIIEDDDWHTVDVDVYDSARLLQRRNWVGHERITLHDTKDELL